MTTVRGRGAGTNPAGRFEPLSYARDPENEEDGPGPATRFFKDAPRSIITTNDSPDVGFEASINPYRGCEHGCIYCYARPTHEYMGFSAGLDFETKIMVKQNAPDLLRQELSSPRWKPKVLAMSGVTDAYQPGERKWKLTRQCLEVLAEFRNPVAIVTKNFLVTRDADILGNMARDQAAAVFLSVTSLDETLCRRMEPRTSRPRHRLEAIETLSKAGVPVGVLVAPVVPGLTDHEIPAIVQAAARAGATFAGYGLLRLPFGVKDLFQEWLDRHFPDRKQKVLHRIQSLRGGKLNNSEFGSRMRGQGIFAEQIRGLFKMACRKAGIPPKGPSLSTAAFQRPGEKQLFLF
jgi:DNA repair photolyase